MPKKYKLVLIQPRFWAGKNNELNRNQGALMPLGLAYIAAYTPDHWEVEILDEQVQSFHYIDADLVGITATVGSITRGYEIAAEYRKKKVPVIMGGVQVTTLPDEALEYCDSVVLGDAEPVWATIIADFESGKLKKRYEAPQADIAGLKLPRTELLKKENYLLGSISTSRGCPFRCTFCAIHNFYDHTYRLRPVPEVIEELKLVEHEVLFFTDGNLYGYNDTARNRFIELCKAMAEERKKGSFKFTSWMAYVPTGILEDNEALHWADLAGCRNLMVGFESINPESLVEANKGTNLHRVKRYKELIENAHKHHMIVMAEIIIGFDNDDMKTLALTSKFVSDANLDSLRIHILQPLPGTDLFDKLKNEGRLYMANFPEDWDRSRDFALSINFEMKQIKPFELISWIVGEGRKFYTLFHNLKNALRMLFITKSWSMTKVMLDVAMKSRKMFKNYPLNEAYVNEKVNSGKERQAIWKERLKEGK